MSINRWMDQDVVYIYNRVLLSHKNEWNNAICSSVVGPRDYNTKWRKSEKQMPYDLTYMWNLKYDTSELTYKTGTDSHKKRTDLWLPRGNRARGGMDWECGVSRCMLLYREWINNKVLLYSTGNYIQYPVINHNGKEYKKEHMYMYNWITWLYSRNNIVNQLYFSNFFLKDGFLTSFWIWRRVLGKMQIK